MKTITRRSLLALLALCSTLVLPAAEIPVSSVPARVHANDDKVTRGVSRLMVALRLGNPSATLPDGTWLYRGYTTRSAEGLAGPAATLVVRFNATGVSSLHLADREAVVALRTSPAKPAGDRILVVTQSSR